MLIVRLERTESDRWEEPDWDADADDSKDADYEPPKLKMRLRLCDIGPGRRRRGRPRIAEVIESLRVRKVRAEDEEVAAAVAEPRRRGRKHFPPPDCVLEAEAEAVQLLLEPKRRPGRRSTRDGWRERTYMCELCGKHLKSSKSLASHREIHFARRYNCELCKRAFHFKDTLRKHMNSHLGLRDYQCEYCAKAFKLHSTLQAHINVVHLGSVKTAFECIVCKKSFHKKDHYDRHTRTHTGERPYACELCEWKFANVFNLRQHKISIHKVMPFPCQHCAEGFKAKKLLAEHCVVAHAIYI
ncbi:Hypothetical predicted protein [Cloeon dipterum]|uniref:C2H2-type domain-containing protein n=1 Tax=Cloeon dipterum TaxID=197152 RepID=A0A8S1DYR7_9INSE|nr:Hypothetical predicted protein [Cloeon dipterum]